MASKFAPKDGRGNVKAKRRNFSKLPQFWSYSRFAVFDDCPYRYALEFIAKVALPKVENRFFERGNKIHLMSEHYISGEIKTVPRELATFAGEYKAVKKLGAVTEVDYTVAEDWTSAEPDDFERAWLRAKLDIVIPADSLTVVDVKSGAQRTEKHTDQGDIYGMLALQRHPEYDEVDVEFWYVDSGETLALTFERSNLAKQKKSWLKRVHGMLKGRLFPKTPSRNACKYCPYRSDKVLASGEFGDCKAWESV